MARQEEGWPLGLHLLNVRVGLGGRARDYFGSISFNTVLTSSSNSSVDSSSDLDTESTGSFFHDRSSTLGSLIRASSILDLSRRSFRGIRRSAEPLKPKRSYKSRTWLFSLCSKDSTDVTNPENPPSLGHFLAVERRIRHPDHYLVPDEMTLGEHMNLVPSSLFLNGHIAPPHLQSSPRSVEGFDRSYSRGLDQGVPVLFSCICCNADH